MTEKQEYPPAVNASDDINDVTADGVGVVALPDTDEFGIFTILVVSGPRYDFVIDQAMANQMIQQLRRFVAGDSARMPPDLGSDD